MTGQANKAPPGREHVLTTEEAALRHVAMLVAGGAATSEILDAVAEQVARSFDHPGVGVMQYESAGSFVVVATSGEQPFSVGSRWPLDGPSTFEAVLRTGRPATIPDYADLPGTVAQAARQAGIACGIGAPIIVDGTTWGVIAVHATSEHPVPAEVETRLCVFTDLVATAISNVDARESLALLAEEQAALRRVAMLVARESSPVEIFGAVTREAFRVLGSEAVGLLRFDPNETATLVAQSDTPWDPPPLGTRFTLDGENVVTRVFRTGDTVRVDDWSGSTGAVAAMASVLGVRSAVAAPVVVDGRLWGTIIAATSSERLPDTTESRLGQFTGLVATAIANAQAREELHRLADEQAALRRVATLVARGMGPQDVFRSVAVEVGTIFGADVAAIVRFEDDGTATVLGDVGGPHVSGKRVVLDEGYVVHRVLETSRSSRFDTDDPAAADMPSLVRALGIRSSVASPIVVEGKLWGAITAASAAGPLPSSAERWLTEFTELVATAVANTQAREHVIVLAEDQAALRRVATLVAEDAPLTEVFQAVTLEVGTLFHVDFSGMAGLEDGDVIPLAAWAALGEHPPLPERWPMQAGDPVTAIAEFIRNQLAVRSTVATPIVVEGRTWGVLAVHSRDRLPQDIESRLEQFSDLVATAIRNAQARGEVARLANEQAALRRIATLVAAGAVPEQVFAAVAEETAATFDAVTVILRYERNPPENVIVGVSTDTGLPLGMRWALIEGMTSTEVYRTGRPARRGAGDWQGRPGPIASAVRRFRVISQVACPIVVEGNLWGVISLNAAEELAPDTEQRLEKFTELVTTAIANADAGIALRTAADEQGALRRVATLVAASADPPDVFAAVTEEIALVLGADATLLCRADPDGATVVGTWGHHTPRPGTRIPKGGTNLTTIVLDTARPARIESYDDASGAASNVARSHGLRSAVGAPILVEGRLWGLVIAGTATEGQPLPSNAEERLAGFTELVATAISNAQAQEELRRLAEQQAALRRVATLVARRVAPDGVFRAVAEEAGGLLGADLSALVRFESDDTVTVMDGPPPGPYATGERVAIDPAFVVEAVRKTGRPARFETADPAAAGMPDVVRRLGIRSAVASPIVVEEAIWGAVILGSFRASFPPETEQRLGQFTELVATGISNASARAELVASRARIVAAGDEARRRIERNLHDGTQQRLIALGLDLQRARAAIPGDQPETHSALAEVEHDLEAILLDLRELSHGLHPPLLSRLGLGPSLRALTRRSPIPVHLDLYLPERPAASLEIALYYAVSEALTNAIKHSQASEISVTITSGEEFAASIVDDGIGGADPSSGSGLTGLLDRIEALGGRFALESPPGAGTRISIQLPVEPTIAS